MKVEVEARNAVAIARFYAFRHITHTTRLSMHLLKCVLGMDRVVLNGGWVAEGRRWVGMWCGADWC